MKCILIMLALAVSASAAVTFDNSGSTQCSAGISGPAACNTTTDVTLSYTTGSGSNRQIWVAVLVDCAAAETAPLVTSVTYAAVSLSQTIHETPSARRIHDLWTLPAGTQPTSGANNLVVTLASDLNVACANDLLSVQVVTVAGVDQTTTYTSTASNSGTATNATVTLGSSGGSDLVVFSACGGSDFTSTTGTQRELFSNVALDCASHITATYVGGNTALQATMSASDSFSALGGSFKNAAAGAAAVNMMLLGVGP